MVVIMLSRFNYSCRPVFPTCGRAPQGGGRKYIAREAQATAQRKICI